eukprot:9043301-Ditylum_brightwellii.AAC.1
MIEDVCEWNKLGFLGWREVPVNNDALGPLTKVLVPSMWQFFIKAPARLRNDDEGRGGFERTLYLVQHFFEVEWNGPTHVTKSIYKHGSELCRRRKRIFITTVIVITIIIKSRTKFPEDASAHVTRCIYVHDSKLCMRCRIFALFIITTTKSMATY